MIRVVENKMVSETGDAVVLRGVNHMFVWTDPEGKTVPEIARTGANAVRVVWERAGSIRNLGGIVRSILDHGMVPIPELHDGTTAGLEDWGWCMLDELVAWWVSDDVRDSLQPIQAKMILNIANELGNHVSNESFADGYKRAVLRLRERGWTCPIMIDATEIGRNIRILREVGPFLLEQDPLRNLVFSIHTWWHRNDGWSEQKAIEEVSAALDTGIPLVIGECSDAGVYGNPLIDLRPLLAFAHERNVGYLVWSWGPGNKDNPLMDMTRDGRFDTLFGFGHEIATHPIYGLKTARRLWQPRSGR
jgi:mannan endo-1,4-beta-mannosidase